MCGENNENADQARPTYGSPPRVRGKREAECAARERMRITPACAGKTEAVTFGRVVETDHPRVCGENNNNVTSRNVLDGSPPRVRGKLLLTRWKQLLQRITPACAGKTLVSH